MSNLQKEGGDGTGTDQEAGSLDRGGTTSVWWEGGGWESTEVNVSELIV